MGVLVCDMLSGPVFLSYDVARNQALPPTTFRPLIEGQIKRKHAAAD